MIKNNKKTEQTINQNKKYIISLLEMNAINYWAKQKYKDNVCGSFSNDHFVRINKGLNKIAFPENKIYFFKLCGLIKKQNWKTIIVNWDKYNHLFIQPYKRNGEK